jgi:hypothetical protein
MRAASAPTARKHDYRARMNPWSIQGRAVVDHTGALRARLVPDNLFSAEIDIDQIVGQAQGAPALVVRSGWLPDDEENIARRWSAQVRSSLDERLAHLLQRAKAAGVSVWLSPRASDLISDLPSTLSALRTHEGLGLFLDPGALLTESMKARAAEHVARMIEALVAHDRCAAVALGSGVPAALRGDLERAAAVAGKPIVPLEGDLG